jgi:muramoyltetrapeptide carboxypeptidase LdcA involved in peptidoglycan recycling
MQCLLFGAVTVRCTCWIVSTTISSVAIPKIFLGYSDITAMHLAIYKHSKLITFHGPITLSRFTDYTQKYFRKALFEAQPIGTVTNPPESNELRPKSFASHNPARYS